MSIKCDMCGRFIAYTDIDNERARVGMELPDSDYSIESGYSLCPNCNGADEPTDHDIDVDEALCGEFPGGLPKD